MMAGNPNDLDKPVVVPDLTGRVILITGGTAGIGAELVVQLSKHNPSRILFTGRNAKSAEGVIQRAKEGVTSGNIPEISFIPCDLSSLASVSTASEQILASIPENRLDILLANAGIMSHPPGLSVDGYEIQFATNHLGHALLIRKLLPLMQRTAKEVEGSDVRIIVTSSNGFRAGGIPFPFEKLKTEMKGFTMFAKIMRYGHSKLANVVYAAELTRRYGGEKGILAFSVTPGVVGTGLVNDLGWADKALVWVTNIGKILSVEEGARNHLWAVGAGREEVVGGAYYEPVGRVWSGRWKAWAEEKDPDLGRKIWEWTEGELERWLR